MNRQRLYPTHVERTEELMPEAVELSKRGVTVDVDTVEMNLAKWLGFFFENGGDAGRITASSDASIKSPRTLFEQVRSCVTEAGMPLERVLPVVTRNTAAVLKLRSKGWIGVQRDADITVPKRGSTLFTCSQEGVTW